MFGNNDMYGVTLEIEELLLFQTGTYNDQYRHDYTVNQQGHGNMLMAASEQLNEVTHEGKNLNPVTLAQLGTNIIAPRAQVTHNEFVTIPFGWGQERFLFMMKVRAQQAMSNIVNYYYLTGYTDNNEISLVGNISPNLKFYINNSVRVREVINAINGANVSTLQGVQLSQVLLGTHNPGVSSMGPAANNEFQMLPSTMAEMAGTLACSQQGIAQPTGQYGGMGGVPPQYNGPAMIETTPMFHNGAVLQTRDNNMPNRWLSRFLTGFSVGVGDTYNDTTDSNMFSAMAGAMAEPLFQNDQVLAMFKRHTSFGDPNSGFISWAELCNMSPGLDNRTKVNRVSNQDLHYLQQVNGSEAWHAATRNAWAASLISQILPSIMAPLMLMRVTFTVTNMVVGGGLQFQIHSNTTDPYVITPKSFMSSNVDISAYLQQFQARVLAELMPSVLHSPDWPVSIVVDAQLTRDIVINLSVGGEPTEKFVFPTFADHRLAPVMTNNYANVQNMSADLVTLANQVISAPLGTSSVNMGGYSGTSFGTV